MRTAIQAKMIQHADVRETLLSTAGDHIVAQDPADEYWCDGPDGLGRNVLGRIWVEVRDDLLRFGPYDELREPLPPPWIRHPEIDRYSIGWRMGYGEAYICEWAPWFNGLSRTGRTRYKELFPAPGGDWHDYLNWDSDDERSS